MAAGKFKLTFPAWRCEIEAIILRFYNFQSKFFVRYWISWICGILNQMQYRFVVNFVTLSNIHTYTDSINISTLPKPWVFPDLPSPLFWKIQIFDLENISARRSGLSLLQSIYLIGYFLRLILNFSLESSAQIFSTGLKGLFFYPFIYDTVCPRISYPFYIVSHYFLDI